MPSESEEWVRVTVGLVTLNEEKTISRSLGALLDEIGALGCEAELMVVAGGTDKTVEIAQSLVKDKPHAKVIVDSEPRGKPAALNRLLSQARGDIVILSDGDAIVRKGSLLHMVRAFDDPSIGAAGAYVVGRNQTRNPIVDACEFMGAVIHYARRETYVREGTIDLATGYLIAFRRNLVDHIPLDTTSDDGHISALVRRKGYRVAYVDDAVVSIYFPRHLVDFLNQKSRTRHGHVLIKRGYIDDYSRRFGGDVRETMEFFKVKGLAGYRLSTAAMAILLNVLSWVVAYARYLAPRRFKKPIWQPIPSTKQ